MHKIGIRTIQNCIVIFFLLLARNSFGRVFRSLEGIPVHLGVRRAQGSVNVLDP